MFIVNDKNYDTFLRMCEDVRHPETGQSHPTGLDLEQTRSGYGNLWKPSEGLYAARPMLETMKLIPRSAWPDLIAQKEREKSWLEDVTDGIVPCEDQNPLSYCWVFCATEAFMQLRGLQGNPVIMVSAVSVGGPLKNWRNVGGLPEDAVKRFVSTGACRESLTSGRTSLDPNSWDPAWKDDCKNFKVLEFDDGTIPNYVFDAQMTFTLLGRPHTVEFDWWGHAICGGFRAFDLGKGKYALKFRNNWGNWGDKGVNGGTGYVTMEEGKGTSSAVYAPRLGTPTNV